VGWAQHLDALKAWRTKPQGGSFGWSSSGTVTSDALESTAKTPLAAVPGVSTLGELAEMASDAFLAKYLEVSNSRHSTGAAIQSTQDLQVQRRV